MTIETIKIIATIFSIIGSIILAIRVTGILSALSLVANAHEANIQQLMPNNNGDIINFGNSIAHVESAKKTTLLVVGFSFFILSGILQLITFFM